VKEFGGGRFKPFITGLGGETSQGEVTKNCVEKGCRPRPVTYLMEKPEDGKGVIQGHLVLKGGTPRGPQMLPKPFHYRAEKCLKRSGRCKR